MKLKEHIRAISADLYLGQENLLATSAETGLGKAEVLDKIRCIIDTANALQQAPFDDEDDIDEEEDE